MDKPNNLRVAINFYKKSGKWYASGNAYVNHFQFEDEYKDDLVNTQNALMDGWQEHADMFVVVTEDDDTTQHFNERLYLPGEFRGIVKNESEKVW